MDKRFNHELLRQARLELGLTQAEAAEAAGVDVRTYRRYEAGEVNTPGFSIRQSSRRSILARLSQELGIEEDELLIELPGELSRDLPGDLDHPVAAGAAPADATIMAPQAPREARWPPRHVHTLERARHLVGRDDLVAMLHGWFGGELATQRVVALVGVGGAGKSSVAERFINDLCGSRAPARRAGGGLLVWSFNESPRTETLLAQALAYFAPRAAGGAAPELAIDTLEQALSAGAPHLLVLDGLETMQSRGTAARAFGELDDPVLRRLLRALARGLGRARALITSRLDLADLRDWEGDGLRTVPVGPLDETASMELLRDLGWHGSDEELVQVSRRTGGHALSLAAAGSYGSAFLGGNVVYLEKFSLADAARDDSMVRRLREVVSAYTDALEPPGRDLLTLMATHQNHDGISLDMLCSTARVVELEFPRRAAFSEGDVQRVMGRLRKLGLVVSPRPDSYAVQPFLAEHLTGRIGFGSAAMPAPSQRHDESRSIEDESGLKSEAQRCPLDHEPGLIRGESGFSRPSPADVLDHFEAELQRALRVGNMSGAYRVYALQMGGFGRLGLQLGDMIRGARLIRGFAAGGEPAALAPELSAQERRHLAYEWGLYSSALGDIAFARRCYQVSLDLARSSGDLVGETTGLRTLGYTARLAGELATAHEHVREALAVAEQIPDQGLNKGHRIRGLALLGAICHDLGDVDAAANHFAAVRDLRATRVARRALWEAEHLVATGRYEQARALTAVNLDVCERVGWSGHAAHCRIVLGCIAVVDNGLEAARTHLEKALAWSRTSGEVEMMLHCRELGARVALASGLGEDAAGDAGDGLHLARTSGANAFVPRFHNLLAEAALAMGEPARAFAHASRAVHSDDAWSRADAHHLAGLAAASREDIDRARVHLDSSAALRERIRHPDAAVTRRALLALA
jgi:transcriptional regulator with XRE-family HTH domain/tetratricopeptide (TPR) repeat protein